MQAGQVGNSSLFGDLADDYAKYRPLPPREGFQIIKGHLSSLDAKIVDLGCGTGNATKQFSEVGFTDVTGVDSEANMLRFAKDHSPPHITYLQANVSSKEEFPFKKETVDAFSAVSSLHWFSDDQALSNIFNALKPGGYLFVIRGGIQTAKSEKPKESKDRAIKVEAQELIRKTLELTKEQFKVEEKKPIGVDVLQSKGFTFIEARTIRDEKPFAYTIDEYVKYLRTFSEWTKVLQAPQEQQQAVDKALRTYLATVVDCDGKISIDNNASFVILQKPLT